MRYLNNVSQLSYLLSFICFELSIANYLLPIYLFCLDFNVKASHLAIISWNKLLKSLWLDQLIKINFAINY